MKSVLTVCTGNICRSPMAQVMLAHALPQLRVQSAGTHAVVGALADPMAVDVMAERGIQIVHHRAQQLNSLLCQQSDLILVMEDHHAQWIESVFPFTRGRTFRVCQHAAVNVPDPYRLGRLEFLQALHLIEDGLQNWVNRIRRIL